MRLVGFSAGMVPVALLLGAAPVFAQDVTNPGDPVTASSANFPGGEAPANVIDNTADTKYLNFDAGAALPTGFTVTPSGTGVVRGIVFITANDAPERDPASWVLEGTDDGVAFTPIASGSITLPTARFAIGQVTFANSATFTSYRVTFPSVRAGSANSMQIAEVQLVTQGDVLTPGDAVVTTLTPGASFGSVLEGGDKAIDNTLNGKMNVVGGNLGPTLLDVTPGAGPTVVTGVDVIGAADDVAFPNRTPSYITISGSNDGVTYAQIFTSTLTVVTSNFQDQQFSFANTTAYTHYRIELGASIDGSMQIGEVQLLGEAGTLPPANDECANAIAITPGVTAGSNINATGTDITACGSGDTADVWYSYTATANGVLEVSTCGGAGTLDTTLAVYDACNGMDFGCSDNACGVKSRVRWNGSAGSSYIIRVAGVAGAQGSFGLTLDTSPVIHTDVTLPLTYNFNGMVHPGESGDPDNLNGYRSISDRGINITGAAGSLEVGLEGLTGIPYDVVDTAFTLDIVHLGNRNTTDAGNHAFDAVPDGDDIGVQPSWLADPDQSGPQITDLTSMNLVMSSNSRIGVLYDASNGGTNFSVTLQFPSGSPVVSLSAPDWFGSQNPAAPGTGVEQQSQLGTYPGTADEDQGAPDVDLNIVEAVISIPKLLADGFGDFSGEQLQAITFSDRTNGNAAVAVYAATVRDPAPTCLADFNGNGSVTVQDIFDFLAAYFASNPTADVNNSGGVTVQDIFDFLAAYFAGCP